ncbi:MAG: hypothetical protein GEU79_10750, partial [Acidimicrobiia bacterium]|nr:hypothetical protein [Acidimicrobiia bacterium]
MNNSLRLESYLIVGAMAAVGFSQPQLVANFTVTDVFIGGMVVLLVLGMLTGKSGFTPEFNRFYLPMVMILGGSILASTYAGLVGWVIGDLIRDIGAFITLFAAVRAIRVSPPRVMTGIQFATAGMLTVLSLQLLLDNSAVRAQATWSNPNIPGHLLATGFIVSIFLFRGWPRLAVLTVTAVGIVSTGSFGAIGQVAVALAYLAWTNRKAIGAVLGRHRVVTAVVLVTLLGGLTFGVIDGAEGWNQARFQRSGSERLVIWGSALELALENPLGVGPKSTSALSLLDLRREPHNEYVAYIVERGPIAFLGLIGLGVAMWTSGRRGGPIRAITLGFA